MRDQYYADNRDLVKWGVLLTLAESYSLEHILQVLYHRPSKWADLEIDGKMFKMPSAVIQHFRNCKSITAICSPDQIKVEVLADTFVDRQHYLLAAVKRIQNRRIIPGIVFLDPDTGLEPRNAGLEHVFDKEVKEVWNALLPGDVLVFYQHQTNRNGQPWIEPKKAQFELALGIPAGAAKIAMAKDIARDVVFFYVQRVGEM